MLAEGHGDQVSGSAYRTLFSDVSGSHWAASYINLACEEGLVSGYGNGTFGPDDPVTVGQAVTVVLRLLGYTTDQVGPFWPEDYMALGEQLGLLEGVSRDPDHALTRGEAALMLYALLGQSDSTGKDYIDNLCASKVENAVLLDADAQSGDGTEGMVEVAWRAAGAPCCWTRADGSLVFCPTTRCAIPSPRRASPPTGSMAAMPSAAPRRWWWTIP